MPSILTVFTWNIHQRSAYVLDLLEKLTDRPDIVTLQEVTLKHAPAICERLHEMGYSTVYSGQRNAETKYGNVIAGRTRVKAYDLTAFDFPIPQLAAQVQVDTPAGPIRVVTVHAPIRHDNVVSASGEISRLTALAAAPDLAKVAWRPACIAKGAIMPKFRIFPRYRKPSVGEILGVTQTKRRTSRVTHLPFPRDPTSPIKNFERRAKRKVGYYSEPLKAERKLGCFGILPAVLIVTIAISWISAS